MLDDDALGMNARISRRDFVNGAAVAVGALGSGPGCRHWAQREPGA